LRNSLRIFSALLLNIQTRWSNGPETSSRRPRLASSWKCIKSEGVRPPATALHIIPDLWVSSLSVTASENQKMNSAFRVRPTSRFRALLERWIVAFENSAFLKNSKSGSEGCHFGEGWTHAATCQIVEIN
jgi:hypothetical protein